MIDLDQTRSIDIESLKLQYADKFASYTPRAHVHRKETLPSNTLPNGKPRQYKLSINPPLLNSSSPWATDLDQLRALYASPYTGAVTTRTSLLEGFNHDDTIHQHIFFPSGHSSIHPSAPKSDVSASEKFIPDAANTSSLNTYGYSPHTLSEYLGFINDVVGQRHLGTSTIDKKPFILSVTGTPDEIAMSYALMANAAEMDEDLRLAMEVNLSCPNIDGKSPPAYDEEMLKEYLEAISDSKATYRGRMSDESVPRVGIKLPPYTWLVLHIPLFPSLLHFQYLLHHSTTTVTSTIHIEYRSTNYFHSSQERPIRDGNHSPRIRQILRTRRRQRNRLHNLHKHTRFLPRSYR